MIPEKIKRLQFCVKFGMKMVNIVMIRSSTQLEKLWKSQIQSEERKISRL